ncbi:MAG: hypothetical protein HYT39_01145 [Candidatus Sungbacteria bacterium]|nr:hypothetical protein [Candidatus Sungbacteria bacterium]
MNLLTKKSITWFILALFVFQSLGAPLMAVAQTNTGAKPTVSQEEAARIAAKAKADAANSPIGAPDYGATCGWTDITCSILWAIDKLLYGIGYLILTIPAALFNGAIQINQSGFITSVEAVKIGWGVARDVANMFFIIILIIVALATIFDLETFNVKSVLPRLITIALLINFSLIIGVFVIDRANDLGQIFYDQLLANGGARGAIIEMLNFPDALKKSLGQGGIKTIDTSGGTAGENAKKIINEEKVMLNGRPVGLQDCANIDHIDPAEKIAKEELRELDSACATLTSQIAARVSQVEDLTKRLAYAIVVKIVIFPVAIFVLLAGAFMLLARLITLIFVLILAPLAFMAYLVPTMQSQWSKWWKTLFDQSFFYPAFMFFFMISVKVFEGIRDQIVATTNGSGSTPLLPTIISYFVGAGLMVGSLIAAKQMGAYGAGGAIGLGQKYLGKIKDYGKSRASSFALRATKTGAEDMSSGLAKFIGRHPILASPLRPVARGTEALARAAAGEEKGREEALKKLDARGLAVEYDRAVAPGTKTIIERVAAETGKLGKFRPEAQREIYARVVGDPSKTKMRRQIETAHPNIAASYWDKIQKDATTEDERRRALTQIKRIPAGITEKDINERVEAELMENDAFMDAAAEEWTPEKHEAAANKFGPQYLEALAKAYNRVEARTPKKIEEIFKNEKMRKFYLGNPLLAATNPWLQLQAAAKQNELTDLPDTQLLDGYGVALATNDRETIRKIESQRPDIAIQHYNTRGTTAENRIPYTPDEIDHQVRRVVASIPEKAIEDGTVDRRFLQAKGVINQIAKGWSVKKLETAMDKVEGFVDEYTRELERMAREERHDFSNLIQDVSKKNFVAQNQVLARMAPTAHRIAGGQPATDNPRNPEEYIT